MKKDLFGYVKQEIEMEDNNKLDYENYIKNETNDEFYDIFEDDCRKKKRKHKASSKSKKKNIFFIFAILLVFFICIGGQIVYIKFFFTADKFLDKTSQNFDTWISSMFAPNTSIDNKTINFNINNPYQIIGNLNFNSNLANYEEFSNFDFNFDVYLDNYGEKAYYNLDISNDVDTIFAGEIYLDKLLAYLNIPNIYSKVINFSLEESPLEVNNNLNLELNDYSALLSKYIGYVADALKESDITTLNKGLSVKYIYEINDTNAKNVTDKLINSISSDNLLNNFISELYGEDWQNSVETIANMTISIEVNIITQKIVAFDWKTEINNYSGKWINENKFRITDSSKDYTDIDVYDNLLNITSTIDNEVYWQISIKRDGDSLKLNYIDPLTKLELTDKIIDNKETLEGTVEYDGVKAIIDISSTVSNKTINLIGDITFDIEGSTFGLEFDIDFNIDVEVPIKIYNDYISSEDLTEQDYNEMANNISELIKNILNNPLYDIFSLFLIDEDNHFNSETYVGGNTITESTI